MTTSHMTPQGRADDVVPSGLSVSDLTISHGGSTVLSGLSFDVPEGMSCALVGPSGSGKSSILDAVAGITKAASGVITIAGFPLSELSERHTSDFRSRHIGLVSQDAQLLDELSIVENVSLPLRLEGTSPREAEAAARDMLERLGIGHLVRRRVDEVSGGEAQRAAIARALCRSELHLVLADEPTAALDGENADAVAHLLTRAATSAGATVLLATHDPVVVAACELQVDLRTAAA